MEESAAQLSDTATIGPAAVAAMGLIAAVVGVLIMWLAAMIMWLAAMIVHVKDATLGRSVLAALAMSILTVSVAGVMAKTPDGGMIAVGAAALILAVMAIKMVYRTSVWKAGGVLILNAMMQIIISSLYLQAGMGGALPSGPS